MNTLDRFEKFAFAVIALVVIACFYAAFISLRDAPVPPHYAPMVIPGPPVSWRQLQPVVPPPVVATTPRAKTAATTHRRHSDVAEAVAYRKAYRNAARANALLGEHRYNTGPLVVIE